MPDFMDAVQERCLQDMDIRIAEQRLPERRVRTTCADLDCCAPISVQRQALRAQLCLECQTREEARARQYRGAR